MPDSVPVAAAGVDSAPLSKAGVTGTREATSSLISS